MNILLMTDGIPPQTLGGTPRIVWELAMSLTQKGHTVSIVSAGDTPGNVVIDGITIYTLAKRSQRWSHYRSVFGKRRAQEIVNIVDIVKPDVIHAHTIAWQCGYKWLAGVQKRNIPVMATAHDVMHVAYGRVRGDETRWGLAWRDARRFRWSWNPLRNIFIRFYLQKCSGIFAVSEALKEFLTRMGVKNVQVMHNGVSPEFWHVQTSQEDARKTLDIPTEKTVFFLAGRLGIDKGVDLIVETLPEDAFLILAGAMNEGEVAHLKDRVRFFAKQSPEEMRTLYTACNVVLVPSRCLDCFPTMCLEGMSMERPVLATSWGGSKESVRNGETGWVLDPFDTAAWRERMAWCVTQRNECQLMGKASRERVQTHFSQEDFVQKILSQYEKMAR
jgi:glycosyltransferase involved in cell wall biosynthesis